MPLFDMHTVLVVAGVALAGALIGLDRTAIGQFMVSQPIVAGPLTGWLLGDPVAGLVVGGVLELIWVLDMPVGTFVPADSTITTVSATAIAVLGDTGPAPLPVIGFSVLLTTAMTPLTMKADGIIRHWNSRLADAVAAGGPAADPARSLLRAQLSGTALFFLKSFALYLLFIPAGMLAVSFFRNWPGVVHEAMSLFIKLLPLLGIALVTRKLSTKTADWHVLAGFAVAAVAGQLFRAPAISIVLLTVLVGWLGARYHEQKT